jgi:hypothetical protein
MKNVEDVYPLSPMQELMLLHRLAAPKSAVLFEQSCYTIQGDLDVLAFQRAWQQVVDRHAILRTAFLSEGLTKPLQVVRRQVKLPIEQQDWRGLSPVEQQERLDAFLQADRDDGFDPTQAPLMRLALCQFAEDTYQFVLSFHHLILDRWSTVLVFREVFALYEAFLKGQGGHLEPPRSYRDYIQWLQQRDLSQAEAYWREALKGFTAPTALSFDQMSSNLSDQEEGYSEQWGQLTTEETAALQSLARQHRLTLNTLLQGAWALLLSSYSGEKDVVFGVTVSGRPAPLKEVESIVGLFTNNLPLRVQMSPADSLVAWFKKIQEQQVELRQYEYSSPALIQEWNEVPPGLPLFESLLVFQNDPTPEVPFLEQSPSLEIRLARGISRTNYPITVGVFPSTQLSLVIVYDRRRFDSATIIKVLERFKALLLGIAGNPEQPLSSVLRLVEGLSATPKREGDYRIAPQFLPRRAETGESYVPPRTPMESLIAGIWQDLLGVDRVSVYDNFLDLGGSSLLMVRFVTRLEKTAGLRVSPGELVLQTLGQLASACETQMRQPPRPVNFAQRLLKPMKRVISHMTGERR